PRDEARGRPGLPAHHVRDGRPRPPSSPRSQIPPPTSPATPALAPAHPRPVSPYPTAPGTNPTALHALLGYRRCGWLPDLRVSSRGLSDRDHASLRVPLKQSRQRHAHRGVDRVALQSAEGAELGVAP